MKTAIRRRGFYNGLYRLPRRQGIVMIFIRPLIQGYAALDNQNNPLYSDTEHQLLFDFVEMDLDDVSGLLKAYFNARMAEIDCVHSSHAVINHGEKNNMSDTADAVKDESRSMARESSIMEKATEKSAELAARLKERFASIHPFLAANHNRTLYSMLAHHLGNDLRFRYKEEVVDKETYASLWKDLIRPIYSPEYGLHMPADIPTSDEFVAAYYQAYISNNVQQSPLFGASYLSHVQTFAKRYLYWVLDASAARFNILSLETRSKLYAQVFHTNQLTSDMRLMQRFYLEEPQPSDVLGTNAQMRLISLATSGENIQTVQDEIFQENNECKAIAKEKRQLASVFSELLDDQTDLDDELWRILGTEIEKAKEADETAFISEYEINCFDELIQLELWLLINETSIVKKCRRCGRYFLTEKMSVEYCPRIAAGEIQPCIAIGPKQSFTRLLQEDSALKAYNKTYKTLYARFRRGAMSDAAFSEWKNEAREKLEATRKGEMGNEEFDAWLQNDIRKWVRNG